MSDTTHDIARLIDQMTQAIDAVRPGGVFSSNSKLSAALFALYEAMPALTDLQAERDAWKARAEAALARAYMAGQYEKRGLGDFRTFEVAEEAIRALPVPADLEERVGGESVDCTPIAWLPTETVQWLKEYDGQACAKMTAAHNRPIKSDGGVPVYLRPALSPDPMDDPKVKALVEALTLAANRLHRCSVDYDRGRGHRRCCYWRGGVRRAGCVFVGGDVMTDTTHKIYINRAHVFDEGVTWTTVAGLYPHAYVPEDALTALQAERDAAEARVAELETLEGASAMVLRYVTDPDWADVNSETFRTMPWQALYDELRKDANDFPALLITHLEAFCEPDFRASLTPPADLAKGVADE